MWFDLKGDSRLGRCATEGCGGQPTCRLESDGTGSNYCSGCKERIVRAAPLECVIKDGMLTISIGVDCLAHAIKFCPSLAWVSEEGDFEEPEITDPDKFAQEVLRELKAESEDGTTLVHIAIDKAAEQAIENGAEGIRIPGDDEQTEDTP